MEAVGLYDFTATTDDELSFKKGEIVKILFTKKDKNWYKAEKEGQEGFVPNNYVSVKLPTWFDAEIRREEAEAMLSKRTVGSFLVRLSESSPGDFSLSVQCGSTVQHFKVLREEGKYFLWTVKFNSIHELVKYHRTNSVRDGQTIYLIDEETVTANYDFKPTESDELELKRGDVVTVIDKSDSNWWKGTIRRESGLCEGHFPVNYVTLNK